MSRPGGALQGIEHNATAHDAVADSYDRKHEEIYNPIEQARLRAVIADLVAASSVGCPDVLDVGAGTGNLSHKFLTAGCRVCAADVSPRSLERLVAKAGPGAPISTSVIRDERLPFDDASFDIVGTYSVLHHIPDYLLTVREMVRVLRPGGLLYIDHEASEGSWRPDPVLAEYRRLTRLTPAAHLWQLVRTGDLFTPAFAKTVFMKSFVNRRYEREGDLHVWPDDHVEWGRVEDVLRDSGADVERAHEYLHYHPRGGEALFAQYRDRCTDMRYLFARKRASVPGP